MLGEPLSNSIRDELDRRKKGLNRDNGLPNLGSGLEYSFSEMMTKSTYVRLISPLFRTEIKGNLLQRNDPTNYFNKTHWTDADGRGKLPPPGITSVRTAYVGEGATINTIKEATIEMKVYSNEQYNKVVPEFVRIGRILYLEFGWSNPRIDIIRAQAVPRDFLTKTFDETTGKEGVELNYEQASVFPDEFAENTNGNSDVLVGTVTNYNAKLNQEGGYDISIDLKTAGHGLYHSSTSKNRHQHIPILNENTGKGDPFSNNLDERNGLILLSKIKANIQEVFKINNAFQYKVDNGTNVDQSSTFYIRPKNSEKKLKETISMLETQGFEVEEVRTAARTEKKYKNPAHSNSEGFGSPSFGNTAGGAANYVMNQNAGVDVTMVDVTTDEKLHGFVAIHKSYKDLIISCVMSPEKTKIGEEVKEGKDKEGIDNQGNTQVGVHSLYLNYYCSMKYIEDNVLTRLFGTADIDSGIITTGIRSLFISQEKINEGIKFPKDNSTPMLESNLMLTHRQLVPKSFTDCLINTEAMKALLGRTQLGIHQSNDKEQIPMMKSYSEALGKILAKGRGFIITNPVVTSDESKDAKATNPNHVQAKLRNMYVNINVVQDSFLGTNNRAFCDRNFFPTLKRDGSGEAEEIDAKDYDFIFKDDITYFQDRNVFFDKMACVGSLREGLMNLYNRISSNFHNFPNFEVGANVHLPGFLSVYDLRNSNKQEHFIFDVYSKNSIVKSLELNSKIPKNVELAATIGASTNFDLTDVLGGLNSGLKAELLQDLNIKDRPTANLYNPVYASSFGRIVYPLTQNNEAPPSSIARPDYDPEEDAPAFNISSVTDINVIVENGSRGALPSEEVISDAPLNFLRVTREKYSPSFAGIAPTYVLQNRPPTNEHDSTPDAEDKKARDMYPDLNKGLAKMSDQMDGLFSLSGKYTSSATGKAMITGIEVKGGNAGGITLNQFSLTHSTIVKNVDDGSRKVPYVSISTHSDYQNYIDHVIYLDNVNSLEKLNNTISYFELSFKIDGISGILPGQAFTVSYLPDGISDNFFFIVKNIEQELTSDGWETSITGLMRRKTKSMPQPKKKSKTKKIFKKKKENIKKIISNPTPKPKPKPAPTPVGDPLPNVPYPNIPVPSDEEDIADDLPLEPLEFEDFSDMPKPPPIPPVPRPSIPVPSDEEDIADDVELEELDFDSFEDWEVPPPPPPFIPYAMVENETANIILQMTDGQANIQPFKDAPQQDVKLYPKGRENSHPIIFSLGVTDVLSIEEFNNIRKTYFQSFGKDPKDLLDRLYTRLEYSDSVAGDDNSNFGEWDKRETTYCYIANRKTEDGMMIGDKIQEMRKTLQAQVGNDPNNTTGQDNDFTNDIINAILNQPERTKLTVLKDKKKNDRKNIKIKRGRPAPMNPALMRDPNAQPSPGQDPPSGKPKRTKKKKPATPPSSYFGGDEWQNNLIYRLVPKWKTLGAVLGKAEAAITTTDRLNVTQRGTYFKNQVMYGTGRESGGEDPVPFSERRKFWDSMIEAREPGASKEKSQKSRCRAAESEIKEDGSYNYLKRLTGPNGPSDVRTYQSRL